LWQTYIAEIDSGRPVKVDFNFWNLGFLVTSFVDIVTQDSFYVYLWGDSVDTSGSPNPEEEWREEIGHAVTGVGYIPNWNGDDWAIVHDNWPTTPENVVIPWDHLMAIVTVSRPRFLLTPPNIDNPVFLAPQSNHCATSSFDGLDPPGFMGIWAPSHGKNLYFPSDSVTEPDYPQAWLTPGVHLATAYGPANVNVPANPTVTVPGRDSSRCPLYVQLPSDTLIDQAGDLNVIRMSSGESAVIPVNDNVETMVFLASCDGDYYSSPDQSLEVWLNYDDGATDAVMFSDIHPAGRGDISNPDEIFIYGNEVFVCNPAYFDDPSPSYDLYHSEAWHWYALYPDDSKLLESITFVGMQGGDYSQVYILAVSYSGALDRGDANGDGEVGPGDVVFLINYLYRGGSAPNPLWLGDANSDGGVGPGDVVYLLNYLYRGGPSPCPPIPGESQTNTARLSAKGRAQISLLVDREQSMDDSEVSEISVVGSFDRDVAMIHLEIEFDPEEMALLEPELTSLTGNLQLFTGITDGMQKIGAVDLSCNHYLAPGEGSLIKLRATGEDLSSIKIADAILVGTDAVRLSVDISSELKLEESESAPKRFSLSQNYPNPFNPRTNIRYALPQDAQVRLVIYNVLGQRVKTLVDGHQTAGYKTVWWDGKDEKGNPAASGVYFYRLEADRFSEVRKMLLVK
jgi:hypothetical protein